MLGTMISLGLGFAFLVRQSYRKAERRALQNGSVTAGSTDGPLLDGGERPETVPH